MWTDLVDHPAGLWDNAPQLVGGALELLTIDRAVALQNDFMERVASRLEATSEFQDPVTGRTFSGRACRLEEYPVDFSAEFDRVQRACGVYDEVRRERMGRGARALWEISPKGILRFGTEMIVLGAVLQPFRELLLGLTPRERAFDDLAEMLPDREDDEPTWVLAVLSPSGWRNAPGLEPDSGTTGAGPQSEVVYRFEPAPGGGYRPFPAAGDWPPAFLALESEEELTDRVVQLVSVHRVDLVLRGLTARGISREAGVPVRIVRSAFRRTARDDEFLRVFEVDGDLVLRRA